MAVSVFDSVMYSGLFGDRETAALFSDSADIRAMLLVEGELARAQGARGIIPADSAEAIWRASREVQIDAGALSAETGRSGVVVPALVSAFREVMQAPEHAQFVHWGATSQDIIDTGLMLRLRQVAEIWEARLKALVRALGQLAEDHADLPMLARTWGQAATVTSFGAVVAEWGSPLLAHLERLREMRPRVFCVSLSGAAGTAAALGPEAAELRADLARALKLNDPGRSWHSTRDGVAELSGWITLTAGTLGKMGQDLLLLAQSGLQEVALGSGGGSSTMPQKSNPVHPSLLVALAGHVNGLNTSLQSAQVHGQQRDGGAWMREWLALPQACVALAHGLKVAGDLATALEPRADTMRAQVEASRGLVFAEALSFALAAHMPRPEAQALVKEMCARVSVDGAQLSEIAKEKLNPAELLPVFDASAQLGTAPRDARHFADEAKRL